MTDATAGARFAPRWQKRRYRCPAICAYRSSPKRRDSAIYLSGGGVAAGSRGCRISASSNLATCATSAGSPMRRACAARRRGYGWRPHSTSRGPSNRYQVGAGAMHRGPGRRKVAGIRRTRSYNPIEMSIGQGRGRRQDRPSFVIFTRTDALAVEDCRRRSIARTRASSRDRRSLSKRSPSSRCTALCRRGQGTVLANITEFGATPLFKSTIAQRTWRSPSTRSRRSAR